LQIGETTIPLRHGGWPLSADSLIQDTGTLIFLKDNGELDSVNFLQCPELLPAILNNFGKNFLALLPAKFECGLIQQKNLPDAQLYLFAGIAGQPPDFVQSFNDIEKINFDTKEARHILYANRHNDSKSVHLREWLQRNYNCTRYPYTPFKRGRHVIIPGVIYNTQYIRASLKPISNALYTVEHYEMLKSTNKIQKKDICRGFIYDNKIILPIREEGEQINWRLFQLKPDSNPPVIEMKKW
jgi:hypothetical protein